MVPTVDAYIDQIAPVGFSESDGGVTVAMRYTDKDGAEGSLKLHFTARGRIEAAIELPSVFEGLRPDKDCFGADPASPRWRWHAQTWMRRAIREEAASLLFPLGLRIFSLEPSSAHKLHAVLADANGSALDYDIPEAVWWVPADRAHARMLAEWIARAAAN